jgi:negative regulator of flagellin synthesis FlgM
VKIDNSIKPGLQSVADSVSKPSTGRDGKVAEVAPVATAAEIALSPLATRLQEVTASLASTPVFDADRVAEIKQAIGDGRLQIDAGKIADGVIEGVRQLLNGPR